MNFEHVGHAPGATNRARGLRRRMTWSERKFWRELRKLDANFRRQAPIGRYFADFAAHRPKLVIEIDGGVHERFEDVAKRDAVRQSWLEGEGYTVLRFTDREVEGDILACVDVVRARLGLEAEPDVALRLDATDTPPSPTLPPSRRKGA